jgi:hypothetical protein
MSKDNQRRNSPVHRIRLGSQWEFEPLAEIDPSPENTLETPTGKSLGQPRPKSQRLHDVSDCGEAAGVEYQGRIRLVRRFGRPSGLTPGNRVELVIDRLETTTAVSLNDNKLEPLRLTKPLEPTAASDEQTLVRLDVSACLLDRNQLAIELDLSKNPDASKILRDVWLEIFTADQ